jgi:hypothetical protein
MPKSEKKKIKHNLKLDKKWKKLGNLAKKPRKSNRKKKLRNYN